jgi:hypothetical protein
MVTALVSKTNECKSLAGSIPVLSANMKIKIGRIVTVDNKNRKGNSSRKYKAVWVEDSDGENERCLLFTERELNIAENLAKNRTKKNIEDWTEKSWLIDLFD